MGLSRPFHVNGSASRSPWMGPRLQVPDPLPFRVNGQATISFQSQEVKKVMGGLSIPKKPHWWSQWIETCPFAGGLEDGPSGRAGAESGSGSVFRRRSLRASLNLPEPSTALSEPESLGCSPACGVLGRGWGLPLRRAQHLLSLTVTLGTRMLRPPALPELLGKDSAVPARQDSLRAPGLLLPLLLLIQRAQLGAGAARILKRRHRAVSELLGPLLGPLRAECAQNY